MEQNNKIFTIGLNKGIAIVFVKHFNQDKSAFIQSIIKYFADNDQEAETNNTDTIIPRRKNEIENLPMLSENGFFMVFVQLFDQQDNNTFITRAEWGRKLLLTFNSLGRNQNYYRYPYQFIWSGDLTGDINGQILELPTQHLINDDAIDIMAMIYSDISLDILAKNDQLVDNFW